MNPPTPTLWESGKNKCVLYPGWKTELFQTATIFFWGKKKKKSCF